MKKRLNALEGWLSRENENGSKTKNLKGIKRRMSSDDGSLASMDLLSS